MKTISTLIISILFSMNTIGQTFEDFINIVNALPNQQAKMMAIDTFMTVVTPMGIPLIEGNLAHFIYRGDEAEAQVAGDFNGWDPSADPMTLLDLTDFWYCTKSFEMNARLDYKFVLDGNNWILDPLNPNQVSGGYGPNSELAMPEYIQPWEIVYNPDIDHGEVTAYDLTSTHLGASHQIQVYTPPNYEISSHDFPTVYFQDGSEYIDLGSAVNVIDNLIDSGKIEPLIGVFVRPNNRNEEYAGSQRDDYQLFFVEEVVPFVEENYNSIAAPSARAVIGDSFGGNISALIAYNHANVFENCGLHSGAFWPNNYEAYHLITSGEKKNIRWASIWGTYEGLYENMREFRDFLIDEEYDLMWNELPEGHSWGLWRASIDDMLKFFFPLGWLSVDSPESAVQDMVTVAPNPFRNSCTISFLTPQNVNWSFDIIDTNGKVINNFSNTADQGDNVQIIFNPENSANGIYHYRLMIEDQVFSGKIIKCRE